MLELETKLKSYTEKLENMDKLHVYKVMSVVCTLQTHTHTHTQRRHTTTQDTHTYFSEFFFCMFANIYFIFGFFVLIHVTIEISTHFCEFVAVFQGICNTFLPSRLLSLSLSHSLPTHAFEARQETNFSQNRNLKLFFCLKTKDRQEKQDTHGRKGRL